MTKHTEEQYHAVGDGGYATRVLQFSAKEAWEEQVH